MSDINTGAIYGESTDKEYWAGVERDKIGDKIFDKVLKYQTFIINSNLYHIWRKCYQEFYWNFFSAGEILKTGDAQEKNLFNINMFKNYLTHIFVMVTSRKLAYKPRAVNSDPESLRQVLVAEQLLDYYTTFGAGEQTISEAALTALQMGEGWVSVVWDEDKGEPIVGSPRKTGDIRYEMHLPNDVIRDVSTRKTNDQDWLIVRTWRNKWELAAQYPEFKDKIIGKVWNDRFFQSHLLWNTRYQTYIDGDTVPVYIITTVAVRRSPAEGLDPKIKSLNYLNNILAKIEAINHGSLEAIMINQLGYVAEATGDNVFIFRKGELWTPDLSSGCLDGITREAVIGLARGLKMKVKECMMTRYDLYTADECFLTGSAAEIIPIVKIDAREINGGKPGPVTKKLTAAYKKITNKIGVKVK
jgi:hypothetical protein